jgi:endogenous inhibitor of DNA gyrase (YacG/DUF329 family)
MTGFNSKVKEMAEGRPLLAQPCANCARSVISQTRQRTYCSDLCSQVADWIRYFQRTRVAGRSLDPDISEALSVKLAHIAAGGYDERGRSLTPDIRSAIIRRDNGACRRCGGPGSEIDHIAGSSPNLSNLQLLCHECHMEKTQESMVQAAPNIVATVHEPIRKRALETPNRQPCDSTDWNHRLWASGVKAVPETLRAAWRIWLSDSGGEPLGPQIAVAGFPTELDAWTWYSSEQATPIR